LNKIQLAIALTLGLALRSKPWFSRLFCTLLLALCGQWSCADTTYETQDDFLKETFKEEVKPAVLWLDKATQDEISKILGHAYPQARLRYWHKDTTNVWVLEEIGKEYPITAGFVITNEHIARAQVLVYRETRGMEIHLPGFLAQFTNNTLKDDKLAHKVDGISGATLSVNAMVKMAQVALTLNQKVAAQKTQP